jgi:hypothetical protein
MAVPFPLSRCPGFWWRTDVRCPTIHRVERSDLSGVSDPWADLETYRQRYEIDDQLDRVLSLQRTMGRRKGRAASLYNRLADLESQVADARAELKAVESEIEGSRVVGALLVDEILDRVRIEQGEGWSPAPILGFRIWSVHKGRLHGAKIPWTSPALTSRCLNRVPGEDMPHSTLRCGPPACGIYATKTLDTLRSQLLSPGHRDGIAIGLVAMTGKVIEHELGYRAASVETVALTLSLSGRVFATADPAGIDALFADPVGTLDAAGTDAADTVDPDRFLETWKEERETWTWEKS